MTTVKLYKTYRFRDKDPIIDELRTAIQDVYETRAIHLHYEDIEDKTGVSKTTLAAWFDGETNRPQNATIRAVANGIGYEYKLSKRGGK